MPSRIWIQVVVLTVAVVFTAGLWLTGGHPQLAWLRFFSAAVTVAALVAGIWDHWLWRLAWVQRTHRVPRSIRGTWRGTLESMWINPETGTGTPAKLAFLVVRQTASHTSATLLTDESRSTSELSRLVAGDGTASLVYVYLNTPDNSIQDRSRMHYGSTSLAISGVPATRLHGHYWTDRDSRGDLDFKDHRKGTVEDYEQAVTLFGS
jgi:hypothetical protein